MGGLSHGVIQGCFLSPTRVSPWASRKLAHHHSSDSEHGKGGNRKVSVGLHILLPITTHWPELNHMTISCKEVWEILSLAGWPCIQLKPRGFFKEEGEE